MGKDTLVYDEDHLDKIANSYEESVVELDTLIEYLRKTKVAFSNNYSGQGKEIALDIFEKIKEHLLYLKNGYGILQEYVIYSKETMIEADKAGASS